MPAKGVCLHAENLSLALLFLIGQHFSSNQKRLLFSLSRFYKRSQLYILYSDDSLDKCQTKSFGKYETSASGYLHQMCSISAGHIFELCVLVVDLLILKWFDFGKVHLQVITDNKYFKQKLTAQSELGAVKKKMD